MSKKLLVLGANGMLGGSLLRYFTDNTGNEVLGTVRSESSAKRLSAMGFNNVVTGVDATDSLSLEKALSDFQPDYVFNCIGLIKQLSQSELPIPAIEINSLLPHKLASLCKKLGACLIHFSTDCVFSGSTGNYDEASVPDATDIYGRSKLLGEVDYDNHITLRTSIIGHELDSSVSLVDWFLSQSGSVKGFSKAVFSGLPTYYMAEFIDQYILSDPNFSGLHHLSADPINKYDLLLLVKEVYGLTIDIKESTGLVINRSLNSDLLRSKLAFTPPAWHQLIEKMHYEHVKYFR